MLCLGGGSAYIKKNIRKFYWDKHCYLSSILAVGLVTERNGLFFYQVVATVHHVPFNLRQHMFHPVFGCVGWWMSMQTKVRVRVPGTVMCEIIFCQIFIIYWLYLCFYVWGWGSHCRGKCYWYNYCGDKNVSLSNIMGRMSVSLSLCWSVIFPKLLDLQPLESAWKKPIGIRRLWVTLNNGLSVCQSAISATKVGMTTCILVPILSLFSNQKYC